MSSRLESVFPVLAVADLEAELAYYADRLGFTVAWRWGQPAVRAAVARDGLELQLVEDEHFTPERISRVLFHVRGVDALYASCVERGADVIAPVEDRPFGLRYFRVADRSGNELGFGEPLALGPDPGPQP